MSSTSELHDADAVIVALFPKDDRPPVDYWRPPLVEFRLLVGVSTIETGPRARALSQLAFANGANTVRWDFDLRLDEPYGQGRTKL